jgi:hypothetical protein
LDSGFAALFLGIGLFLVGSTNKIVYTYVIEVCQFAGQFQRQRTFLPLVLGIQGLIAHQICGDFLLLHISVFP